MKDYDAYYKRLQNHWLADEINSVIAMAEEGLKLYSDYEAELYFELAQAYITGNNLSKALEVLSQAGDKGFWYAPATLPEKEQFHSLRDEWSRKAGTVEAVSMKAGNEAGVSMLALHGWGEDLALFRRYWSSPGFEEKGAIHYLQSSQRIGSMQYCWDDRDKTSSDCRTYWASTGRREPDILAGFSQGGMTAFNLVAEGTFRPRVLYLLCPGEFSYGPELRPVLESLDQIHLLSGEKDYNNSFHQKVYEDFSRWNMPVKFESVPAMGHWFPDDLGARLASLIEE